MSRLAKGALVSVMLSSFLALPLHAAAPLKQLDRYSVVDIAPIEERYNVMKSVITVPFSEDIHTVGHAVIYLLKRAGYRLAELEASHPKVAALLDQPLPTLHRTIGPITLEDALQVLAGEGWITIYDPVNRLVSFDVDQRFLAM